MNVTEIEFAHRYATPEAPKCVVSFVTPVPFKLLEGEVITKQRPLPLRLIKIKRPSSVKVQKWDELPDGTFRLLFTFEEQPQDYDLGTYVHALAHEMQAHIPDFTDHVSAFSYASELD